MLPVGDGQENAIIDSDGAREKRGGVSVGNRKARGASAYCGTSKPRIAFRSVARMQGYPRRLGGAVRGVQAGVADEDLAVTTIFTIS